jgi:hypothetical protein
MKTIKIILTLALFLPIITFAQSKNSVSSQTAFSNKVEAYYFHFTVRCETCRTVEAEAKQDIETLYPGMVKNGEMSFQAINLDDASSKAIAEKLKVSGQSLLLVKGDKQINITNEGFLYARTNPEKFKTIIKEKVDGLLNM